MGLFGINDNLSTFALTKARKAERKVLEIESVTVTSVLSELDTLNNVSLILSQEIDNLESKVSQIETTLSNLNTLFNNIKNTVDDLVIRVENLENI